jgi:heptose I phosphotransferase
VLFTTENTLPIVRDCDGDQFQVASGFQPLMRMIALDADAVFNHPDIRVWRSIPDRENCTLDAEVDGRRVRWHVKRYSAVRMLGPTPAEREVQGIRLLENAGILTVPLVAWGVLADRRSFVIVDDLVGYQPGDKLLAAGESAFDKLLEPTADLAAKLHGSGLHHRDLYLCHFFVPAPPAAAADTRLIDCARVKRLPRLFTRYRWVVKDLSQFWYSTLKHPEITDEQRIAWLRRYAEKTGMNLDRVHRSVARKVAWIGRHDAKLNRAQPNRNISIPRVNPRR